MLLPPAPVASQCPGTGAASSPRLVVRVASSLALAAAAAACGGGNGAAQPPAPPPPPVTNPEILTIQAGVALYDGVAGFFRMLNLVGMERLTGQAESRTIACPGGGTVVTNKLASPIPTAVSSIFTIFTLTANQCRFAASDGLIYNGVWVAEGFPGSTTYSPSGVCPTSACGTDRVGIRTDQARYGYGVATDMVPSLPLDITSTPAAHTINVFFSGVPITNESPRLSVFGGNQQVTLPAVSTRLVFDVSLQAVDPVRGPIGTIAAVRGDRETLQITAPFKAALTFSSTNVVAAVDRDGNGTVDINYTIPWTDFLEPN